MFNLQQFTLSKSLSKIESQKKKKKSVSVLLPCKYSSAQKIYILHYDKLNSDQILAV